jgi:hypothetical protein
MAIEKAQENLENLTLGAMKDETNGSQRQGKSQ